MTQPEFIPYPREVQERIACQACGVICEITRKLGKVPTVDFEGVPCAQCNHHVREAV